MQKYNFATIVTVKDGVPSAAHLPFLVEERGQAIILRSHFTKANPQSRDIDKNNALIIFSEPHAYISPKNYEKEDNVPTWNYLAVHAYGICTLIDDNESKSELLKDTIRFYEAGYQKQWENLRENYQRKMMNGITAFEVEVHDLQAKKKLSQNRTETERKNIINDLANSGNTNEQEIARYMKKMNCIDNGDRLN